MSKHRLIAAALLAATVAALVGVSTAGGARHATTISVMAVWTGAEQKSFEAVLAGVALQVTAACRPQRAGIGVVRGAQGAGRAGAEAEGGD